MRFYFVRLGLTIGLVFGIVISVPAPRPALASRPTGESIIDISASINGDQIMAGVRAGSPPSNSSTNSDCEWSPAVPRDAVMGSSGEVFKQIGPIQYQLFDYTCSKRTPPTTFYWIPQISTTKLATETASVLIDNIPALWGEFAPPARRGVVNLGTWFWVNPIFWLPFSITAWIPTIDGPVSVTTTATPKKLHFTPGDGALGTGEVECDGPGMWWFPVFGDSMTSPCMYTYHHSSALDQTGAFGARLGIEWHITWKSSVGLRGDLGHHTLWASHQIVVRELQALITK